MNKTCLTDHPDYRQWCKEEGYRFLRFRHYKSAVRHGNKAVSERLINGDAVNLPYSMGILYIEILRKSPMITDRKTGERKMNPSLSVNWNATKKLWEKDPEAKKKSLVIYFMGVTQSEFPALVWDKFRVRTAARNIYMIKPTSVLMKAVGARKKRGDAVYFKSI